MIISKGGCNNPRIRVQEIQNFIVRINFKDPAQSFRLTDKENKSHES